MDEAKAEGALETLERTCSILWNAKTGTIPAEVLARLPLSLVTLDHQSVISGVNVHYFTLWTEEDLRRYERNLAPVEGNERISCDETVLLIGCPMGYTLCRPWGSGGEWAETMCSRFVSEVDIAPRKGTKGDMLALKSLTGWRYSMYVRSLRLCYEHDLLYGWKAGYLMTPRFHSRGTYRGSPTNGALVAIGQCAAISTRM